MAERIDNDTRARLLALYEFSGNASKAGREVGIEERQARRIVQAAWDDGTLAESARKQRACALDSVGRMMLSGCETAAERVAIDHPADSRQSDPGPQYLKAISDVHRSLTQAERLHSERAGEVNAGPVTIIVGGPDVATDDRGEPVEPSEADPSAGS